MARITKAYDERLNELLDAAWRLFMQQGYESTTVNDIIREVNIAKGTFYHYFSSKEELLDSLVERHVEEHLTEWNEIISRRDLDALEKMNLIMGASKRLKVKERDFALMMLKLYYSDDNYILRRKVNRRVTHAGAELLVSIIEEGNKEGVFNTLHPKETVGVVITMGNDLLEKIVPLLLQARENRTVINDIAHVYTVYQDLIERMLGIEKGGMEFFNRDFLEAMFPAETGVRHE